MKLSRETQIRRVFLRWHLTHRGGVTKGEAMKWFGFKNRDQVDSAMEALRKGGLDIRYDTIRRYNKRLHKHQSMGYYYVEGKYERVRDAEHPAVEVHEEKRESDAGGGR